MAPIFLIVYVIIILVLIGGYFGYTKWWQPKQCVAQEATSNVSTFIWKDGKCVANVCVSGFTGDDCSTVDTSCPIQNCKTCGSDHTCTKCIDGYGDGTNKPVSSVCPVYTPIFKLTGLLNTNKCEKQSGPKEGTLITPTTNAASQSICEQICIGTQECNAYDWNSVDNTCELWKGTVQADPYSETSKNYTCYRKPTSS